MDIISLHSQKGGTGKTSLALGLAIEAARLGKNPLLIDLDFSGTSLRDVIHLKQGEKVTTIEDYFLDPRKNNPDEFISRAEITDERTNTKCEISIMLDDSANTERMMSFVYKENHSSYLESRLESLIETIGKARHVQTIIMDNSPGAWGLSTAVLNIIQRTHVQTNPEVAYKGTALLVSSADLNDVISCLNLQKVPQAPTAKKKYTYVINRSPYTQAPDKNIAELAARIDTKAQQTNDEGTKGLANLLRTKSINIEYAFPEDAVMSQMYRNHLQIFPRNPLTQIQTFGGQVLNW